MMSRWHFVSRRSAERFIFAALVLLANASAVSRLQAAAETDFSGRIEIRLAGALAQMKAGQPPQPKFLDVYAECDHGTWHDVWGASNEFNRAIHLGRVSNAQVSAEEIKLKIDLTIGSDHWVPGGPASYEIDLKRDARSDTLDGSFSGRFEGPLSVFESNGKVSGRLLPPVSIAPGFQPVQPGEHPRLLFRKADLPALRAKAGTPFGKGLLALLEKSDDPVALGLMYQLTGDKSYAGRAKPETLKVMENRNGGPFALGRFWGYRTSVVGTAYDLCYDAWEPEFREQVENYLDWILYKCLHRMHRVGTVNWTPGSNYTVVIHAGNGMAALALEGEKGPAPVEPLPPRTEPLRIDAPADFTPGENVPVVKFQAGAFPTEWLYIGPFSQHVLQHEHPYFDYKQPVDCLASIGGVEGARPTSGDKVTFKNQTLEWKPLSRAANPELFESINQHAGKMIIKSHILAKEHENTQLFYYTVLDNQTPGWFQFDGNFYEGKCFVAGQRIVNGEHFFLGKGRFPLLVPQAMADGEFSCAFEFLPSSEDQAKVFFADPARLASYQKVKREYEDKLATWKAQGGVNRDWHDDAGQLNCWNYLNLRGGMGDGGFQGEGEGYTLECHHVIHDYAIAYKNVFGRSVTGQNDIGYFAPRYIFTGVWTGDEKAGRERCISQSFGGHGGGTIPAKYLGRSIDLCPPEWKPVVLWHWLKQLGVSAETIRTEDGAKKAFAGEQFSDGLSLAEAFIHYPLEMNPVAPDGVFPHVWEAKTRGFCAFRNNWKDGDQSIVAQIYAKAGEDCGWSQAEAGTFQIYGLGHAWTSKDNDSGGKEGSRWLDNVVMMPQDPIDAWAHGRVTNSRGDAQSGSGSVSFDLGQVYRFIRKVGEGKSSRTEQYDGGVTAVRAFAADFSGKSGTPALFAVADRVTGGGEKIWTWRLPPSGRNGPDYKLDIASDTFTITYPDASLKVTFVSRTPVKIAHVTGTMKANPLSGIHDVEVNAIHVTNDARTDGNFLAIITLQTADAPSVKTVDGNARVGNATVNFDGEKITVR
jgi:hypothetical protein